MAIAVNRIVDQASLADRDASLGALLHETSPDLQGIADFLFQRHASMGHAVGLYNDCPGFGRGADLRDSQRGGRLQAGDREVQWGVQIGCGGLRTINLTHVNVTHRTRPEQRKSLAPRDEQILFSQSR
ncbi:hypothetical protein CRUP_019232 [Coryphaenoides rupestris]|nr:hypothetical protein CRUP_019232 [Coryphaenoides rupestris]